jgi:hypothetical protein
LVSGAEKTSQAPDRIEIGNATMSKQPTKETTTSKQPTKEPTPMLRLKKASELLSGCSPVQVFKQFFPNKLAYSIQSFRD